MVQRRNNRISYIRKHPKDNIIKFNSMSNAPKGNKQHPTQKPVALMEYLNKNLHKRKRDTVLGLHNGFCGSTGVAAKNLKPFVYRNRARHELLQDS
jgi:DNA modification methylase